MAKVGTFVQYILNDDYHLVENPRKPGEKIGSRLSDRAVKDAPKGVLAVETTDVEYPLLVIKTHLDGTIDGTLFLEDADVKYLRDVPLGDPSTPGSYHEID